MCHSVNRRKGGVKKSEIKNHAGTFFLQAHDRSQHANNKETHFENINTRGL
jgi:hypothetical protein